MKSRKKLVVVSALLLGIISSGCSVSTDETTEARSHNENTEVVEDESDEGSEAQIDDTTTESEDYTANMDLATANAFESGLGYLEFTAFSREGLIEQLSSSYGEGFTEEQAITAVSAIEEYGLVDWNDQAVKSAQSYLDFSAFSRNGLIDQLSSEFGEQFTQEQAEYAVTYLENNGLVDWNEQAVKSAQSYLEFSSFSRQGLIDQLSSEYGEQFTQEQAIYAADQIGLN